ncbi:MAG: dTMP kinase [Anaerolineales bacterium]|nr:dTMP kinase [Anaerolineales bacterium]
MFITFEGPEGSGKTSQIRLLAGYLRLGGYDVVETREPGGTAIGDQIRACLHDVRNTEMAAEAEILLYSASRAQLVRQVIRPALARGQIVLCDRFADSTLAYQGYGRLLPLDQLKQITSFATGALRPDLTFLLDIDVERGLARRRANDEEMNRLDLETVAFHQRVRRGYHALIAADPARWLVVDADRPVDAVQADLRRLLQAQLPVISNQSSVSRM